MMGLSKESNNSYPWPYIGTKTVNLSCAKKLFNCLSFDMLCLNLSFGMSFKYQLVLQHVIFELKRIK